MENNILTDKNSEIKFFGAVLLILLALLVFSLVMGLKVKRDDVSQPGGRATKPFPTVSISARAAYVYDLRTKEVLYAKNEDVRVSLASLTKIMSALVAREAAEPNSTVVISRDALRAEGDSGFRAGEKWNLKDLIDFSLVTSSNDGMRAIALALGALKSTDSSVNPRIDFVRMMNERAQELDLKNTYFFNETGLDETEYKGGAYGTAKDIASLFGYVLSTYPDLLEATKIEKMPIVSADNKVHKAKNTNTAVNDIPGILASKTGFTDVGGGNLVIAFDPEIGRPIVVAVLGSTVEGRFADVKTLVDATMEHITGEQTFEN